MSHMFIRVYKLKLERWTGYLQNNLHMQKNAFSSKICQMKWGHFTGDFLKQKMYLDMQIKEAPEKICIRIFLPSPNDKQ